MVFLYLAPPDEIVPSIAQGCLLPSAILQVPPLTPALSNLASSRAACQLALADPWSRQLSACTYPASPLTAGMVSPYTQPCSSLTAPTRASRAPVQGRQLSRLLWSALLHASEVHIFYNMSRRA